MGDYDSPDSFFCTLNALPRPDCGSVAMEENFYDSDDPANIYYPRNPWEVWDEWSKGRYVDEYGICEHHKIMEKSQEINGH